MKTDIPRKTPLTIGFCTPLAHFIFTGRKHIPLLRLSPCHEHSCSSQPSQIISVDFAGSVPLLICNHEGFLLPSLLCFLFLSDRKFSCESSRIFLLAGLALYMGVSLFKSKLKATCLHLQTYHFQTSLGYSIQAISDPCRFWIPHKVKNIYFWNGMDRLQYERFSTVKREGMRGAWVGWEGNGKYLLNP